MSGRLCVEDFQCVLWEGDVMFHLWGLLLSLCDAGFAVLEVENPDGL